MELKWRGGGVEVGEGGGVEVGEGVELKWGRGKGEWWRGRGRGIVCLLLIGGGWAEHEILCLVSTSLPFLKAAVLHI